MEVSPMEYAHKCIQRCVISLCSCSNGCFLFLTFGIVVLENLNFHYFIEILNTCLMAERIIIEM